MGDMKKNAKTMASLMKQNDARCFETVDVATGVSSGAADIGINQEDDDWRPKSAATSKSSRYSGSIKGSSRPSTAMVVREARMRKARDLVTNRPKTAAINRIQATKNLKKLADIVNEGPLTSITKYEQRAIVKEHQLEMARNMTPAP